MLGFRLGLVASSTSPRLGATERNITSKTFFSILTNQLAVKADSAFVVYLGDCMHHGDREHHAPDHDVAYSLYAYEPLSGVDNFRGHTSLQLFNLS